YGSRREDLMRAAAFAEDYRLRIVESSAERQCVVLSGTVASFERAFKVELANYEHSDSTYRSYEGPLKIPGSLHGIFESVHGLDNRSVMTRHIFVPGSHRARHVHPLDVAQVYNFPEQFNGEGQTVAIIELGGGFYESDIRDYFERHNLPMPKVTVVEIDGQKNEPASPATIQQLLRYFGESVGGAGGAPRGTKIKPIRAPLSPPDVASALWTIEATMDIQLVGAFANAAHIVVYFAPNNDHGKYHAFTRAITDRKHRPGVISCSWGGPETDVSADVVHLLDRVFQDAALRGVTICFSSGDTGDGAAATGKPVVHFPASSPHVLSCGGTHWVRSKNGIKEVTWDEPIGKIRLQSGGGVSEVFERPEWQYSAGVELKTRKRGRGVPDVSGKADIAHGYQTMVGGFKFTMGGTSAAAPMWASLVARLNQAIGQPIGYLTPFLYQDICRHALHGPTEGNNGTHYRAGPGWDACTGLGTPDGKKILAALQEK
ncbi:MAG TPA: S53 family peptidase, partial [Blastocatellia bacterium]|nr:S53 family peptidase [Blastocatellia bacterium]